MNAARLLVSVVSRKLPGAEVTATSTSTGLCLAVTSKQFRGLDRADREAMVYASLDKVPLELLARIVQITCTVPDD